jgi:hypothetical protein
MRPSHRHVLSTNAVLIGEIYVFWHGASTREGYAQFKLAKQFDPKARYLRGIDIGDIVSAGITYDEHGKEYHVLVYDPYA